MKSQVFTLLLLTIGALSFQSTHQYRLQKRELTEYDLTSFIVSTCSADNLDMLIQNLCDQTLESTLKGNFPVLMYYCKLIGSENRYCAMINRNTIAKKNLHGKKHRFVRSQNDEKNSDPHSDFKAKQIIASCLVKMDKNSIESQQYCKEILREIQQGQYPEIKRLCESHPQFNFCRDVLSFASSASWPSLEETSSLLSSPSHAIHLDHSSIPPQSLKLSDVDSTIVNPEKITKNMKKIS